MSKNVYIINAIDWGNFMQMNYYPVELDSPILYPKAGVNNKKY